MLLEPSIKEHKKGECVISTYTGILPKYASNRYAALSMIYMLIIMQ